METKKNLKLIVHSIGMRVGSDWLLLSKHRKSGVTWVVIQLRQGEGYPVRVFRFGAGVGSSPPLSRLSHCALHTTRSHPTAVSIALSHYALQCAPTLCSPLRSYTTLSYYFPYLYFILLPLFLRLLFPFNLFSQITSIIYKYLLVIVTDIRYSYKSKI
jgi:hypothetical protein